MKNEMIKQNKIYLLTQFYIMQYKFVIKIIIYISVINTNIYGQIKSFSPPNRSNSKATSINKTSDEGFIITGGQVRCCNDFILIKTDSKGDIIWTKSNDISTYGYRNECEDVQQTTDGGYIAIGTTDGYDGVTSSMSFAKYNSKGILTATKFFYLGNLSGGSKVQQTSDGGYIGFGFTNDVILNQFIFLVKTDMHLNYQWSKYLLLENNSEPTGGEYDVYGQQIANNGFIVATSFIDANGINNTVCMNTDSLGKVKWQKKISDFTCRSIVQTDDGGYVMGGTYNVVSPSIVKRGIMFVKMDEEGDTLWTRLFQWGLSYSNNMTYPDSHGGSAIQTADGGFLITGYTDSLLNTFTGDKRGGTVMIKLDVKGNFLWSKYFCNDFNTKMQGVDICQANDKGYALIGYTNVNFKYGVPFLFIKTDSLGNLPADITTSVSRQISSDKFLIFPNPAKDFITIDISEIEQGMILTIINVNGQDIIKKEISDSKTQLNISDLQCGIYFAKIQTNKKCVVKKFVKE